MGPGVWSIPCASPIHGDFVIGSLLRFPFQTSKSHILNLLISIWFSHFFFSLFFGTGRFRCRLFQSAILSSVRQKGQRNTRRLGEMQTCVSFTLGQNISCVTFEQEFEEGHHTQSIGSWSLYHHRDIVVMVVWPVPQNRISNTLKVKNSGRTKQSDNINQVWCWLCVCGWIRACAWVRFNSLSVCVKVNGGVDIA